MRWGILIPPSSFSSPALKRYSWTLWHDQTPEGLSGENWGHSSGHEADQGHVSGSRFASPCFSCQEDTANTSGESGKFWWTRVWFWCKQLFLFCKLTHSVWCNELPYTKLQGGHQRIWGTQLEWKHLQLLQAHLRMPWHRYTLMPSSSRGAGTVVTAGLQQGVLHSGSFRAHPWGNLRLVWTQAPGNCSTHPAIRRTQQLCLQGQRQWHSVYGTGPSGRNRVPPCTETAASVHILLGAQHIRLCRSAQFQWPYPWSQAQLQLRVELEDELRGLEQ